MDRWRQSPAGPPARATAEARLLQLVLGLSVAYVAFLVGWFWKTRGRPDGVGRVVRF